MLRSAVLAFAALTTMTGVAPFAKAQEPDLVYTRYGEQRAFFRDWLAACRPDGYCSALGYNGAGPTAAGVDADFILRVGSPAPGGDYEIIFTGVAAYVDAASPIRIWVDGREVARLEPGGDAGWGPVEGGGVNDYRFSASAANQTILPAMKAGAQAAILFIGRDGERRRVPFSLMGLTAALDWIEGARFNESH